METLADRLDAALPQTQCTRCGFAACRPSADAVAQGGADVNRCPPGGERTIARLAALTGRAPRPLDPQCGQHGELHIARIDEARCIGCTLCIDACPVDAILGAAKQMHVVIDALCSGCELCLAPCPVDCIELVPAGREWTSDDARAARIRHREREARRERAEDLAARGHVASPHDADARRDAVAAAMALARARRVGARPQ